MHPCRNIAKSKSEGFKSAGEANGIVDIDRYPELGIVGIEVMVNTMSVDDVTKRASVGIEKQWAQHATLWNAVFEGKGGRFVVANLTNVVSIRNVGIDPRKTTYQNVHEVMIGELNGQLCQTPH